MSFLLSVTLKHFLLNVVMLNVMAPKSLPTDGHCKVFHSGRLRTHLKIFDYTEIKFVGTNTLAYVPHHE